MNLFRHRCGAEITGFRASVSVVFLVDLHSYQDRGCNRYLASAIG